MVTTYMSNTHNDNIKIFFIITLFTVTGQMNMHVSRRFVKLFQFWF